MSRPITKRHLKVLEVISRYSKAATAPDYAAIAERLGHQPKTVRIYASRLRTAGLIGKSGLRHPRADLSPEQIANIRAEHARASAGRRKVPKGTVMGLAQLYGVEWYVIRDIVHARSWLAEVAA